MPKKGYKQTEEHKRVISIGNKGKHTISKEHMDKIQNSRKINGYHKHSIEEKEKISLGQLGHKNYYFKCSEETKEKLRNVKISKETLKKISDKVKLSYANGHKRIGNKHHRKYFYNERCYRSNYEVKVAKYLDSIGEPFEYESQKCRFHLFYDATYIIDFYLPRLNKYIEVKGYWDAKSEFKYLEASKVLDICIVDGRNIDNINLDFKTIEM